MPAGLRGRYRYREIQVSRRDKRQSKTLQDEGSCRVLSCRATQAKNCEPCCLECRAESYSQEMVMCGLAYVPGSYCMPGCIPTCMYIVPPRRLAGRALSTALGLAGR